jgi:MFS transporter, DHA2 family, multidrug resistance protein
MNVIGGTIKAQATFLAYADCFALLGLMLVAGACAVMMLRKGNSAAAAH